MSNTPDKASDPKGFAGLDSLVSDVEKDITDAKRAHASSSQSNTVSAGQAPRQPTTPDGTTSEATWQQPGSKHPGGLSKGWWWAVGIAALVMWVIGNQGGKKSLPPAVSSISSQAPSSPIPEATSGSSWNEEKPPPGVGRVLNYAQLRYCVAEDIRVKAMEGMINRYRGVEVGGFNSYVSDFNGRCGSFKYRSGSLESVRSDAANRTAQIEEEARQRVLSWRSQSGALQPRLAPATAVLSVPEARSPGARRSVRQTEETGASAREESKPVSLSADEGTSLEAACSNDRYLNGPVAYKACLARQIEALERAPRGLKITGLSADERQSTEAACSNDKYLNGPAAYNRCIARQLASLSTAPRDIDLSSLSRVERESLDAACSNDKYLNGPAALNACIGRQVAALRTAPRNIDMSALNGASRSAVEMACSNAKYLNGPAAYNRCLSQQVTAAQR